jgi:hypothetical protein
MTHATIQLSASTVAIQIMKMVLAVNSQTNHFTAIANLEGQTAKAMIQSALILTQTLN